MKNGQHIAVVTPNTDTFTNPTLTALFQLLRDKTVKVFLFGPVQQPSCPASLSNIHFIESHFRLSLFRNPKKYCSHFRSYERVWRIMKKNRITTLLAVDPLGMIIGGRIKRFFRYKIYVSYLSFEIFFKEELNGYYLKLKNKEILYSQRANSLLIQDEKRKELLLEENRMVLPDEKIFLIPVSPLHIDIPVRPDTHQFFSIPRNKKLAVYSGSVGSWCGTHAIIQAFDNGYWDERFWLVFHTRKHIAKDDKFYQDLVRLNNDKDIPFTLHPHPFDDFKDLTTFLSGFDLALALYFPNHENPYYGKNMKEIGLSSGKFSTYMMLGLPTIVTSCSIFNQLINIYDFGIVINNIQELYEQMKGATLSKRAPATLFKELLDPWEGINNFTRILNKRSILI